MTHEIIKTEYLCENRFRLDKVRTRFNEIEWMVHDRVHVSDEDIRDFGVDATSVIAQEPTWAGAMRRIMETLFSEGDLSCV